MTDINPANIVLPASNTEPFLRDSVFVVFDFETTGLYPYNGDEICEIGAVRMRGGEMFETFSQLVNPLRPIPPAASAVNGISDDMVRDAPLLERVFPEFVEFVGGAPMVAHNAPFDMGFFSVAAARLGIQTPTNSVFDTLRLSRQLWPEESSHSLHKLRIRHSIPAIDEHRALDDAMAAARLLALFLARLETRNVVTVPALSGFHGGAYQFDAPRFVRDAKDLPPGMLETMRQAVIGRRSLEITYKSSGGAQTVRTIEPLDIVRRGEYYYIVAHCRLRGAGRTFRLDRVSELREPGRAGKTTVAKE